MIWYRIVDHPTAPGCDESGDPLPGPGGVSLRVDEYEVIRETPCGVWLEPRSWWLVGSVRGDHDDAASDRLWVKRDARRRFACPTLVEAVESFLARKDKQERIYKARARYARMAALEAKKRWGELSAEEDWELLAS